MNCPICASRVSAPFVEIKGVPVHVSALHRTPDGARTAPRGDLALAFCDGCGFIWNAAYDASIIAYDTDYENSLDHSPAFVQYIGGLAERLVERYDVRGKRVVEVGCGQADFLKRLCAAGDNLGFGYDPSYVGEEVDGAVTVRRELYSEETVGDADPDFVCCRHVLEHIEQPLEFVRSLRRTLDAERGHAGLLRGPQRRVPAGQRRGLGHDLRPPLDLHRGLAADAVRARRLRGRRRRDRRSATSTCGSRSARPSTPSRPSAAPRSRACAPSPTASRRATKA